MKGWLFAKRPPRKEKGRTRRRLGGKKRGRKTGPYASTRRGLDRTLEVRTQLQTRRKKKGRSATTKEKEGQAQLAGLV